MKITISNEKHVTEIELCINQFKNRTEQEIFKESLKEAFGIIWGGTSSVIINFEGG